MKVGDMVRYKKSAIRAYHTDAMKHAAKESKPLLVVDMQETVADLLIDGRIYFAYLSDLTKQGL
mgnify:CR=1 FL=1